MIAIAMIGVIPAILALFLVLPPRRAMLASFFGAWLFLPMASYSFEGFPDYTKVTATMFGLAVAILLFDPRAALRFRPTLLDVPILIWCFTPFASSIVNGYGPYDGLSTVMYQSLTWLLPWLIGRIYLGDQTGMRDFALALVIAGLVYTPFCVVEMLKSPQFHRWVYGYHQHDFLQQVRGSAYRPMVFMQHGLALGAFMASSALAAAWLWISGSVRTLRSVPMSAIAAGLLVVSTLCRSTGATLLLVAGLGALLGIKVARTKFALVALAAFPLCYMGLRATGVWDASQLVSLASIISPARASSLQTRLDNENLLVARALERPVFGWAGQGAARVRSEDGEDISITDGLWVIALGNYGLVGLFGLTFSVLGPALAMLRRAPARVFASPGGGPAAIAATLLLFHASDNLMNAMLNPLYFLAGGGLASAIALSARAPVRRRSAPRRTTSGVAAPAGAGA